MTLQCLFAIAAAAFLGAGPLSVASPAPPSVGSATPLGADDELRQARSFFDALDYDRVIPLAQHLSERADATMAQKLDAAWLLGSSVAVVGEPIDAREPFRFLVRGRPEFELPPGMSPKIAAIFRLVQAEERVLADRLAEVERARIVGSLTLEGAPPTEASGGNPVPFRYRLRDPHGAVAELRLQYRRQGEATYSSLPFVPTHDGFWACQIPGSWTENQNGLLVEYQITTVGRGGEALSTLGAGPDPLRLKIGPGTVADTIPVYKTVWFWSVVGGAVTALLVGGIVAYKQASTVECSGLGCLEVR